jgi:hypothetical protein
MKLLEKVWVNLHEVYRGGIWQSDEFHETEQKEQVVQFHELLAQPLFVAGKRHTMEEIRNILADLRPTHGWGS